MNASRLRTGRRSTCEPGRNAFTPMSTERPPFTRAMMVPFDRARRARTRREISSQTLSRSAFSLERTHSPSSFSRLSRSTSTASPALTADRAVGLRELVERDHAFGLVADVDDDVVLADLDDRALDDVAFLDVLVLEGLFEQRGEALLLVVVLGCHRNHAVFLCLSTLAFDLNASKSGRLSLSRASRGGSGCHDADAPTIRDPRRLRKLASRQGKVNAGGSGGARPRRCRSRRPGRPTSRAGTSARAARTSRA